MSRKRTFLYGLLVLLILLLAGCGGEQNPLRFDNSTGPLLNGFWDGFVQVIVLFWNFLSRESYELYDSSNSGQKYRSGYVIGTLLFYALLLGGGRIGYRRYRL